MAIVKKIVDLLNKDLFKDFLPLSYLGARICYSAEHPLELIEEEKFRKKEKFKTFLLNLAKHKHFSVFAHTPIFIPRNYFSKEELLDIAKDYFKAVLTQKEIILNLRHLAERITEEEFSNLIDTNYSVENLHLIWSKNYKIIFNDKLSNLNHEKIKEENKDSNEIFAYPEVIIIKHVNRQDWITIIAHNYSRIFSHQFVRHTWLNFNQRSHRYTKVDKFVIPETFTEEVKEKYKEVIETTLNIYNFLTQEKKIKKEDARFLVPQGVATTIIASAPTFAWKDFISKRAIPQAQEEIRKFATFLKQILLF